MAMSDRLVDGSPNRWVSYARSVNEVATELGCDWHTVNDTVLAYGTALVDDDPTLRGGRGPRTRRGALGRRRGPPAVLHPDRRRRSWPAPRRGPRPHQRGPMAWLAERGSRWRRGVRSPPSISPAPIARCSPSWCPTPSRSPIQFHLVKLANTKLDECRRRVQNETLGHRGRKSDPLYRCRRLLTKAEERLDDQGTREAAGPPAGR